MENLCSQAYTTTKLLKRGGYERRRYTSASTYTEWTKKEAEAYLTTGWGEGAITELKLEYLYGPEPEVSGE